MFNFIYIEKIDFIFHLIENQGTFFKMKSLDENVQDL